MALLNGSFEIAGAEPGLAQSWVSSWVSSVESYADFSMGVGGRKPREDYEAGWNNSPFAVHVGAVTLPFFNSGIYTSTVEGYEHGWANDYFFPHPSQLFAAAFSPGNLPTEHYEHGWANDAMQFSLAPGDVTGAVFGNGSDTDDFESGWGNDAYAYALGGGVTIAQFDGPVPQAFENFEHVTKVVTFVVDHVARTFTAAAHGFLNGQAVQARGAGLPTGMAPGITYFVIYVDVNTFQLSDTAGPGLTFALADNGNPALAPTIFGDPASYWPLG